MEFLSTIGNLLLFLVSLCFLICLHEVGHLSMAKLFKVYCYEYSIGMGPLIYKHRRKKDPAKPRQGETQFSIRALPIGGYVSMAGDEEDEKDRTNKEVDAVPKSRTINGISWWKQIIIFVAGVTVNFFLGFVFFFCSYVFCPQPNYGSNTIEVMSGSKLIGDTVAKGDVLTINSLRQVVNIGGKDYVIAVDEEGGEEYETKSYTDIQDAMDLSTQKMYLPKNESDYKMLYFTTAEGEVLEARIGTVSSGKGDKITYAWDLVGFSITEHYLGFVEGVKTAAHQWGTGTVAIFKALGTLFTKEGWASSGGIISVFRLSEKTVSMGVSYFLNYWGLISVNLAIFNLLPIPGLDGWQIIVAVVEGAAHKKIPNKVKTWVSAVGMGLLFLLMGVLLIKDIIFPLNI